MCVSPYPATCIASLVGGVCVCVTLSGDLPCGLGGVCVCVSPYPATCLASLVGGVCVCVTLSGDLPCESCRRGVCVCHPIRRLALRVL